MFSEFIDEIKRQIATFRRALTTREFWIYVSVICGLLLIAYAGIHLAAGFDPFTRGRLGMSFSCRTGERQIGTIIVGAFVFGLACIFTLGELVHWVEEARLERGRHRQRIKISHWRPILHIVGTVILGVGGYFLMSAWCT